MAPNVVTLLGFGFIIINVLTVLYLNPTLDKEQPRWAYFSYAVGLFLYQTFDACDGTHARRTGQSGPLGELFDHCIDSLNTTLSMYVFCSVVGVGYGFMLLLCQFSLLCNFYLSTWEEFHTHKLFLSEFSGPVEGILMIIVSFIITGIYGPELIWHTQLFTIDLYGQHIVVETVHLMFFLSGIGLIFNILSARRNVVNHYVEHSIGIKAKSVQTKNAATGSVPFSVNFGSVQIQNADKGLIPFFVYFATVFFTAFLQPKFIALPFIMNIGLTMAFTVGRIIIGHLTHQDFPMKNPVMFIPSLQLATYCLFVSGLKCDQTIIINNLNWFGFGLTLGIHGMFITEIIHEFTTYLDIFALSIKHPNKIE